MKRSLKLVTALVCCLYNLHAQKKEMSNIQITLNGGQGLLYLSNFEDINSNFQIVGYPAINKPLSKTVGGVGVWINRFYFQAGENTFSVKKLSSSNYTSKMKGSSFELYAGYNILRSQKLKLFPYVGVGNLNTTIYIDPNNPPVFAAVLSNPSTSGSTKITTSDISSGLIGVGVDWKLMTFLNNLMELSASFRGGYQYCSSEDWRVNDQLTTSPLSNYSGTYFSLGLQVGFRPRFKDE